MPELLPRFSRAMQAIEDARKLSEILRDVDAVAHPESNGRVYRRSADGHNWQRRRGLPIISKGVGGTAPGTDPAGELLRKEAHRTRSPS